MDMTCMNDNSNYCEVVKKAQSGCQENMSILSELAEPRMSAYIYRLTLDRNLTQDIQQETILEMVKSIKKLREPERFWGWLYRIAFSKVQHFFRSQQKEKGMSKIDKEYLVQRLSKSDGDGLQNMVKKELSQAVIDAMVKLNVRHRNILVLRCFDQLSYSEIAGIIDCSESTAQVRFYRAKQSLKHKLTKHGFRKGMLLAALGLFGQMTTQGEAAPVFVSAGSVKVGGWATIIGAAGTRLGITLISLFTAAVLSVGGTAALNKSEDDSHELPDRSEIRSFHYIKQSWNRSGGPNPNLMRGRSLSKGAYEQWYYFPDGIEGPMYMMMQRWDPQLQSKLCGWMQNSSGNYYYHSGKKTIFLHNYHLPLSSGKTRRLPTDTPEFLDFLDSIEGEDKWLDYTRDPETGLLVGVLDNRFYNAEKFTTNLSYNTLNKKSFDSFRYPWPEDASVVDERDEMYKRGWTYFRVNGEFNGQDVTGCGRIPFIYDTLGEHYPWLKLKIGDSLTVLDTPKGAYLLDSQEKVKASYPSNLFFKGMSRPWMGMNIIDLIRREAAEKRIKFKLGKLYGARTPYGKAEIIVEHPDVQIFYYIDIDKDVVDKIRFVGSEGNDYGFFEFTYLQEIDRSDIDFSEPEKIKAPKSSKRDGEGILWFVELL